MNIDQLFELPFLYFVNWAIVLIAGIRGFLNREQPWGIPVMMVMGTVAAWYLVDIYYNGYDYYRSNFSMEIIDSALFQVLLFVLAFLLLVGPVSRWVFGRFPSPLDLEFRGSIQERLEVTFPYLVALWAVLAGISLYRVNFDWQGLFFPYFAGYVANPWGRDRIGGGLDFLISTAGYVYTFVAALLGVVFVLTEKKSTRWLSAVFLLLAWPLYLFNRARNIMLAVTIPAVIAYTFLSSHSWTRKIVLLTGIFLLVNFWMLFVISSRGMGVSNIFKQRSEWDNLTMQHEGLNMFEELCWISQFIETGDYQVNWGRRYFADAANWVPRRLWPGKPSIGIDYAIARGQGGGSDASAGVYATISTGMIGQGVVNFGTILGPIAAALLMALWCGLLGKLWLERDDFLRAGLFFLGAVLTFNMGRDITLLVVFPMVFGLGILKVYEYMMPTHHIAKISE